MRLAALSIPVFWLLMISGALAFLGPYGTHALGWPNVWIYWGALVALGMAAGWSWSRLAPRLLPGWPPLRRRAAEAFAVSIPVTAAVFVLDAVLYGGRSWERLPLMFVSVLVISAVVIFLAWGVEHLTGEPTARSSKAMAPLLERLPRRLRGARILALSSEDHYTRVRTSAGEALVLMRLSDAAAACAGLDGARTHRSWWVARAAVADARKGDGRGTLILHDGAEVPVSRTHYPHLRKAGWF
jgi:hypothetical protein